MCMADIGSVLSTAFGGNSETSEQKQDNCVVYKSPTTNSYTKCIKALSDKFSETLIKKALELADPHDQNSFLEKACVGEIVSNIMGVNSVSSKTYLYVRGTYKFALFAHLKTVEMWIENKSS
jgi:hypothetical protein